MLLDFEEMARQFTSLSDPAALLAPYLEILPRRARQRLIRSTIRGARGGPEDEIQPGEALPHVSRSAEDVVVAEIIRYTLFSGEDWREANLLQAFDVALRDPLSCAKLLTYKSMLQRQAYALQEDLPELDSNWPALHQAPRIPLRAAERSAVIARAYETLNELHEIIDVDSRHPLVPTRYRLFMPSWRANLVVADALDQAILEVSRNSKSIYRLTPRDFERFLGRLFEGLGFEVELTAATRDGGVDLICLSHRTVIPMKVAVEAKRFAPEHAVEVSLVECIRRSGTSDST